ncbi:MAG: hypothetical protein KBA51_02785 [Kiritimatiellae bacterium]|nr:hypothetical protein [Kiritimatiellia bacterium]
MKRIWISAALACLAGLWTTGCDWDWAGSDESVSDRFNWVSFSGVYRAASGSVLITDYSITAEVDEDFTDISSNEAIATAGAMDSVFAGAFANGNVEPGSVQIVAGGYALADDGEGVLSGGGKTGTIAYSSGAWSVDLGAATLPAGTVLRASYSYTRSTAPGTGGPNSGVTGRAIFSLTVVQSGNRLTITDNNGATYSGQISSIRSSGGVAQNLPGGAAVPADGDTVIASFDASGTSAAGVRVRITGAFSATADVAVDAEALTTQIQLANRKIDGTWIEPGKTGDINGVTGAAAAAVVAAAPAP